MCSALIDVCTGQKQTCAALRHVRLAPIATAKADIGKLSCLLYPRKRTCAVQLGMSALPKADSCGAAKRWSLFD
jgi:hypothetical protein